MRLHGDQDLATLRRRRKASQGWRAAGRLLACPTIDAFLLDRGGSRPHDGRPAGSVFPGPMSPRLTASPGLC
jgi:hypothetical protein